MSFVNILDTDATVSTETTGLGGFNPPPAITRAGGHFLATWSSGGGFNSFTLNVDSKGSLALPCNIRFTLTEKLATVGGMGGDGSLNPVNSTPTTMSEVDSLASPQTYTATGVLEDEGFAGEFHFSASGEYFESIDLVVEVDGFTPPPTAAYLIKDVLRVFDPGQAGQEALPASHECVPNTPPPPPGTGHEPPPPGGGSNPPGNGGATTIVCTTVPLQPDAQGHPRFGCMCITTDANGSSASVTPGACP